MSGEPDGANIAPNTRPHGDADMLYSVLGIVHLVLLIIAVVDIVKSGMSIEKKLLWILIIALLPLIGLIVYFLIGRG
jgi:hypothetical protein